ncbi:MAG: zinc-dependent alcohol dehydrogenase [Raoultibacter sp.]|jgi:L-iditol 2-dehydrogenase
MANVMNALIKTAPEPGAMEYVEDFPMPELNEDEVLIEIKACGICGTDHSLYKWNEAIANSYKLTWPSIFGHEFAGVIAEVGAKAPADLKVGDRVTANPVLFCGTCAYCEVGLTNICDNRPFYGTDLPGAFAKYMKIRGSNVIKMPDSVSFVQGALIEPLGVAINAVERLDPQLGDTACIIGPGAIGLLMASVLKFKGVSKVIVTGLGSDAPRLEIAEKLGCITVNGSEVDPIEKVKELTGGRGVNLCFDAAGHFTAVEQAIQMVDKNGKIGLTGLPAQNSSIPVTTVSMREISLIGNRAYERKHFRQALLMLDQGLDIDYCASHVMPLSDWQKAMDLLDNREGLRIILEP